MARDPTRTPEPVDYRLIAMMYTDTAMRELCEAGAEGFRIAAVSEHGSEGVFILHRAPGTPDRYEFQVLKLDEATAGGVLREAETDGWRTVCLVRKFVVLERPAGAKRGERTATGQRPLTSATR
jgi:hypothetical protein